MDYRLAAGPTYHRHVATRPSASTWSCIRHGQSTWNAENLFTGWVDVDLTPAGEAEARAGGELLAEAARRTPTRNTPSTCGSSTPRC